MAERLDCISVISFQGGVVQSQKFDFFGQLVGFDYDGQGKVYVGVDSDNKGGIFCCEFVNKFNMI